MLKTFKTLRCKNTVYVSNPYQNAVYNVFRYRIETRAVYIYHRGPIYFQIIQGGGVTSPSLWNTGELEKINYFLVVKAGIRENIKTLKKTLFMDIIFSKQKTKEDHLQRSK